MHCCTAISNLEDSAAAADEVARSLAAQRPPAGVDLLVFFVSIHHVERIAAISKALRDAAEARVSIGSSAESLIGGTREFEGVPALVAFAVGMPGIELEPFHAEFEAEGDTGRIVGFPFDSLAAGEPGAALVMGDPFTFPMDALLRMVSERAPGFPLIGGMASGAGYPGMTRMVLDDAVVDDGTVGVVIRGKGHVRTLVSQGCRPVGRHLVITKGKENVIEELGGRPAVVRLQEVIDELSERDRGLLRHALHIGRAIDEYKSAYTRGDFLVRMVMGIDKDKGAIAINDFIRRGQTVQFHVRDPDGAAEDLSLAMQEHGGFFQKHAPRGALLFSCNGRGRHMFGRPDHDVSAVLAARPGLPVAGFFAAGEVGPVGGQNFLHGFTASIAVFCDD